MYILKKGQFITPPWLFSSLSARLFFVSVSLRVWLHLEVYLAFPIIPHKFQWCRVSFHANFQVTGILLGVYSKTITYRFGIFRFFTGMAKITTAISTNQMAGFLKWGIWQVLWNRALVLGGKGSWIFHAYRTMAPFYVRHLWIMEGTKSKPFQGRQSKSSINLCDIYLFVAFFKRVSLTNIVNFFHNMLHASFLWSFLKGENYFYLRFPY